MSVYPSNDQLLDLFNWASPGMIVTDAKGDVVLANKAAFELLGAGAAAGAPLAADLGVADYAGLLTTHVPVENRAVRFPSGEFGSGYANIGFGQVAGRAYGFWALRPVTTQPTPGIEKSGPGTGAAWINRVNEKDPAYVPVTAETVPGTVELLKAYYDTCPVAIHLIEQDGTVGHANWKDIALVGKTGEPDSYVGHHIRHIYADQEVVDDFLGRWGEDAPIIDFRADLLNSGERVPVVIFSTAHVEGDVLKNTRCFVFPDNDPSRHRDRVAALDLAF